MMRKLLGSLSGVTAGALLSLCLMATAATAQTVDKADRGDTVKIHVSGDVVLDYAYRSRELTGFIGAGLSPAPPDSETTVEGYAAVNLTAELSDNISAVVELGTKGVDGGATTYYGNGVTGTSVSIVLREAHVNINEFLMPELSLQAGITTWSFNPRGKGGALMFDPRHSSSWLKNLADATSTGFAAGMNPVDELDTAGLVATYTRENLSVDIVLLPVVMEFGPTSFDESLYAVDFMYKLDDMGSQFGAIVALTHVDGTLSGGTAGGADVMIITAGGGVALNNLMPGLEVYGEAYFQFGTAGQDGAAADIDAAGMALRVGAQYTAESDIKPTFGAELTWYTGDDTAGDGDIDNVMSYESINDLMIIEDMYWGLDIDTNYMAIKVNGGVSLSIAGGQNNLDLSIIAGFVTASEDHTGFAALEDGLGNEVDLKASWHLNSQVSLNVGIAYLFGSDILEASMGGPGPGAEDNATLFSIGVAASF